MPAGRPWMKASRSPSPSAPEGRRAATWERPDGISVPGMPFLSVLKSPSSERPEAHTWVRSGARTPRASNAMNAQAPHAPWVLSFSFARALQDDAMRTWAGRRENVRAAQDAFARRARMNSLARQGKWSAAAEQST